MRLTELLPEDRLVVPLVATSQNGVIDELLAVLPLEATARDLARKAILARAAEETLGIGRGVAVPHGWTPAVEGHLCAFGVAAVPVHVDAVDGRPCRLFFLSLAHPDATDTRAHALAKVARLLNDPRAHHRLEQAASTATVQEILLDAEAVSSA